MARGRLPMRKVKKVLEYHFDAGRSHRDIAMHCGVARRSVALLVERFEGSGLSWPEARDMDEGALQAALYPPPPPRPCEDVDWARVEKDLSERGVTLKLLWEEWRDDHSGGMSYPTWCRRFRQRRRSQRAMTMRQVRAPGERLFVDYAGMTVGLTIDGTSREAQVFVASMGVSGLVYAEATLTQKIDDWCASHVRCFEAMGCVPLAVVPDNIKPAVIKPSRYEPVLNETYADLLDHYGAHGLPARSRRPRDKGLVENGVLQVERRVLAPMRHRVFHDLASLNAAIAAAVEAFNHRPYSDGSGESRRTRFEAIDRPHMKPLPASRWQRTEWRQNKVHKDYHIAIDRHFYSVPYEYIDLRVDVRLRGDLIEVFHKGQRIASHARSRLKGRATTVRGHQPLKHQRAGIEGTRAWIEREANERGAHVHGFVVAVMGRYGKPELGFRSCLGVLRLAGRHDPERFDAACRYALELGSTTYRGLDAILRTGADLADAEPAPEAPCPDHANIRGAEYFR